MSLAEREPAGRRADMTRFSLRSKTNIYVRHSLNSLSAAPRLLLLLLLWPPKVLTDLVLVGGMEQCFAH